MTDLRELLHEAADAAPDATGLEQRVRDRATGADLFTQLEASFSRRSRPRRLAAALSATPPSTVGLPEPRWRSRLPSARIVVPLVAAALLAPPVCGAVIHAVHGSDRSVTALGPDGQPLALPVCEGWREYVDPADLPDAMRLVSTTPGLTLTGPAEATRSRELCAEPLTVLSLLDREPGGVTQRRVILELIRSNLGGLRNLGSQVIPGVTEQSTVQVRGVTGQLMHELQSQSGVAAEGRRLVWTGTDGQQWLLSTYGLSAADVVTLADALQLHGAEPARLPPALAAGYADVRGSARPASSWYSTWYVEYHGKDDTLFQLGVGDRHVGPAEGAAALRAVTVNGRPGEWSDSGNGMGNLFWEVAPGIGAFMIYGAGIPLEKALAIAEGFVPAPDDDPIVREANHGGD